MADKILYLEDNHLCAELVERQLAQHGQVKVVSTEHEFRRAIDDLLGEGSEWPDLVVLDQRVKWTNPVPNMPIPPVEIVKEGTYNAGLRCYEYLR